ncbi:hypothetical protein AAZV13_06G162400 [Glycine max]
MLTEKSDVYSFGILIMELITGRRSPVDYSKPQGEVLPFSQSFVFFYNSTLTNVQGHHSPPQSIHQFLVHTQQVGEDHYVQKSL